MVISRWDVNKIKEILSDQYDVEDICKIYILVNNGNDKNGLTFVKEWLHNNKIRLLRTSENKRNWSWAIYQMERFSDNPPSPKDPYVWMEAFEKFYLS